MTLKNLKHIHKIAYSLFLIITVSVSQTDFAYTQGFSKYAGEFLAIGVGARAQALGSAFVAVADDATATYWNPAGLGQIDFPQISLMHSEQFAGEVSYDFAGVVLPFKQKTTFGISLIRLGISGIPDTRYALIDTVQANGKIDEGERLRLDKITYFTNSDYSLFFSMSHKKSDNLYFGGNVKLIKRGFGDFSAWGIGFDASVFSRFGENLTIGANLMDATSTILAWDTGTKELIAPMMKIGAAYLWAPDFHKITFRPVIESDIRFEGRKYASQFNLGSMSFDMHYGLEANLHNRLYLRSGIDDLNQISFGIGVLMPKLVVDYSFTSFDGLYELGNSHRISLVMTIEEEKFRRRE